MTHPIDAAQLLLFVQLLEKYPNETHVRAFPPNGGINRDLGARVGVLDRDLDRIQQWNQEGRGLYVVINNGGNNDASIVCGKALFVEWDDKPIEWQINAWEELGLPRPTCQVLTGGKSVHSYWRTNTLSVARWRELQERLIHQAQRAKEPNYRQQRLLKRRNARHLLKSKVPKLRPLSEPGNKVQKPLPIDRGSYVALLDASVRALKVENATGVELLNPLGNHSLLSQLGMQGHGWLQAVTKFHRHYALAAGSTDSLLKYQARRVEAGEAMRSKTKWVRGMAAAKLLYET